jgi:hypothetical protein
MNNFNDLLPEEKDPQYEELIALLKRAYSKPVSLSSTKEARVLERVRERLMQRELEDSLNEDMPVSPLGVLDSTPLRTVSPSRVRPRNRRRLRLIALLAAVISIVLLGTNLLLLRSLPPLTGSSSGKLIGPPTLTLSSNASKVGGTVTVNLKHFAPSTPVALTHDIQEAIQIDGSATITTDAQGTAAVPVVIDTSWGTGFHLVVAEDVATRYTASATLQITEGPTPPPHLILDTSPIHMGADVVGANTIRMLTLANGGGGSITWSASSNKPWLLVSPSQGIFSQNQTISLAVQRVGLQAGDYRGVLTISSNVGIPQHLQVDMSVRSLPPNAGPVLAVSPALLSFTTTDGGPDPNAQTLTMSSQDSRPLNWLLAINAPATAMAQAFPNQQQGSVCRWLRATPLSGTMTPGTIRVLTVSVQSQCLLPGTYQATLQLMDAGANIVMQTVNVSLTVQPHCGLVNSTGYLAFTVVQKHSTLANQTLSLNTTPSCAGAPLSWASTSSASWLVIPSRGLLKGTATTLVPVNIYANSLAPGIYSGNIIFFTGQSTLTVIVQLTVQAAPPLLFPIMGVSPLSLNFSNIQGQPNPTGQSVTITNHGKSPLKWNASAIPSIFSWLDAVPTGGIIPPGQSGQVTINVSTTNLTPGTYVQQVTFNGMDAKGNIAAGSPQAITVTLVVQPPCTISPPSSSTLSFSGVQGASTNPPAQTVMFTGTGNCSWPVSWQTSVTPAAPWLTLTPSNGTVKGSGQSGSLGVNVALSGLAVGTYTTQVTITATDSTGATVAGSGQTVSVTLTITGFTVSGSVQACPGSTPPTCATPQALPGASLSLTAGVTTITATADGAGNYVIAGVPLSAATITVSGTDAGGVHYVGTATLTVSGDTPNFTIQVFPG